jgi:hypothetical protein
MVFFQTKNPNLDKFLRLLFVMDDVGIYYDHLAYFTRILHPSVLGPGLPDGIFSCQKCKYCYILVCLEIKNFVVFHGY